MKRVARPMVFVVGLTGRGCGPLVPPGGAGTTSGSTSTSTSTSTSGPSETGTAMTGGTSGLAMTGSTSASTSGATADTGAVFIGGRPLDAGSMRCSIFDQNCPAGQKCMPWADDGGDAWNAAKCSLLDPKPAHVGETWYEHVGYCMIPWGGAAP